MRFREKSVLVTGAAGGIGGAAAVAFAAEGARLVLVDVKDALDATAGMCREAGAQVRTLLLDVTADDAPERMTALAREAYGRLDVAFNNVGITGVNVDVADYPDETWDRVMAVNVRSIFRAMKAEIRAMRAQGEGGAIVNTASVASLVAMKHSSAYIAAKHALLGLTKAAALDVIADGIRVNAVCPGIIDTPLLDAGRQVPGLLESITATVPNGRMGLPQEVARCVLFLASEESSYLVGHGMVVDGGVTLA
jgi:NAD(P)-dependent dehydrogenase (short-subunit alcohol dehydrogenase family)